jgi:hypothetical protein
MSVAIKTIREAIRSYEGTSDPRWRSMWAEKVRSIGKECPEAAPWAEAFELCIAYNAEQERACAAWMATDEISLCSQREAMRDAIIGAFNGRTFAELEAMTAAERFADGIVPKWLQRSWNGESSKEAGGARTRLDRELA